MAVSAPIRRSDAADRLHRLNVVLVLLACGLVAVCLMLNVDLDDVKRRLSKEVEATSRLSAI